MTGRSMAASAKATAICVQSTSVSSILKNNEIDVIDCVEFSERLRYSDVASEIAFLAMDLDRLGAPMLADELVEAYAEITGDEDLAVFVPFYKCYRACVRGKVESLRSLEREVGDAERERARQLASEYFALASHYARCASPCLIVVCGLSGSGKSTVARMLQHRKGFKAINSDRVRKRPGVRSPRTSTSAPTTARIFIQTGLRKSPTTRCWPRRNAS